MIWQDLNENKIDGFHNVLSMMYIFFKENPTIDYDKSVTRKIDWYSRFKYDDYEKTKRYDECTWNLIIKIKYHTILLTPRGFGTWWWEICYDMCFRVTFDYNYELQYPNSMYGTVDTWNGNGPWTSNLHCPSHDLWTMTYNL